MEVIRSEGNKIVKEIKRLLTAHGSKKERKVLVEGERFVKDALSCDANVEQIVISEDFELSFDIGDISLSVLGNKLFCELTDTKNPQGIVAIATLPEYSLNDVLTDNTSILILDSIQDPGNLGTIIRTAEAGGFDGVLLSKGTVSVYNSKVLRSTMGSIFRLPIIQSENLIEDINLLKNDNVRVCAADAGEASENIFEMKVEGSIAVVIGNEANGVSGEILELADKSISIPMVGKTESLNASVAAGIIIYEISKMKGLI